MMEPESAMLTRRVTVMAVGRRPMGFSFQDTELLLASALPKPGCVIFLDIHSKHLFVLKLDQVSFCHLQAFKLCFVLFLLSFAA